MRPQIRAIFFKSGVILLRNRLHEYGFSSNNVDGFKVAMKFWQAAVHPQLEQQGLGVNTRIIAGSDTASGTLHFEIKERNQCWKVRTPDETPIRTFKWMKCNAGADKINP